MPVDPRKLSEEGFNWSAPSRDEPTAEPLIDLQAQLDDMRTSGERRAVYYSPAQQERPDPPEGAIVIEDFDRKGGTLVTRDLETADYALDQQTEGRDMQELIGELTLAGQGKPAIPDGSAYVVQRRTPEGAVQRESVVATPEEASALQIQWGEGTVITGVAEAVQRRADLIQGAARDANLSAQLVADVINRESGGNPDAVSSAGAMGLMQLMEGTAEDLGVDDPFNEEQNVRGGTRYLRQMLDKYEQDVDKALAAYNWGPGNLDKHLESVPGGADWRVGLPRETANYVLALGTAQGYKSGVAQQKFEDPGYYQYPTRESMDTATRVAQAALIPGLQDSPILSHIDWEQSGTPPQHRGGGVGPVRPSRLREDGFEWSTPTQREYTDDDYGWGQSEAWMRGWIRLGMLVDSLQGDVEEYTEGAELLKKYGVSAEDEARLQELQETDGFWEALGYYIKNPALAGQVVLESLPMSIAPLLGGLGGGALGTTVGPVGTVLGSMAGAGAGSFATEYLASWDEVLQEEGIDTTNAAQVKAAWADPEIVQKARERGAARGIGVAAFDALSMGLAGRIYKPVKALTGATQEGAGVARRAAGSVVGGSSEIIAQGAAGAFGELSAQDLAGQERDWAAAAGEFVGELVPGVIEAGITKTLSSRAEDTDDTGGTTPAERDVPDDTDTTRVPETTDEIGSTLPEEALSDIEDEAKPRKVEPPPESEQATTPTKPPEETAPVTQEEVDVEAALKAQAEKEEAEESARLEAKEAEAAEDVTPVITIKDMAPKLTSTFQGVRNDPVRKAWKGVVTAITERYSDADLPTPGGAFTGTGLARFFKKLQEEVDITQDIPEINELLTQIGQEKAPADIIKVLNGLAGKIKDEAPSLGATAAPGSVAAQIQADYNSFVPWFRGKVGTSTAKTTKGKPTLKGTSKRVFAERLGQFAGAVKSMIEEYGGEAVIDFEGSGLDANWAQSLDKALEAMDSAMAPQEKKTKLKSGEAGKAKTIPWNASSLIGIAEEVVAIAENLTPKLAELEAKAAEAKAEAEKKATVDKPTKSEPSISPEKGKGKAKVEAETPVTEAPAKPKKAEKAKKTSKKREAKKAAPEKPVDERSYQDLRKRAKELGIDTTGKKPELLARVQEAEKDPGKAKRKAEAVKEQEAEVERQKKLVPARYRGKKYFFHAVAKDEDIQTIVEQGLKKGTNVSRIGGQALSGEGDTILVFEGKTDQKGYQDDQLALGGERPIAIIKDTTLEEREAGPSADQANDRLGEVFTELGEIAENYGADPDAVNDLAYGFAPDLQNTKGARQESIREGEALGLTKKAIEKVRRLGEEIDSLIKAAAKSEVAEAVTEADVLQRYRQYGVSVYSTTGKRVKPDIAGAAPGAVTNPEPEPLKGAAAKQKAAEVGETEIGKALQKAGVTADAAAIVNGLKQVVSKEQWDDGVVAPIYEYMATKDLARASAMVQEAFGDNPVAGQILEAIASVAIAFEEQKAIKDAALAEAESKYAEEESAEERAAREEEAAYRELTGNIEDTQYDEGSTEVDEWGVPFSERLRSIYELVGGRFLDRNRKVRQADSNVLNRAFEKIRSELTSTERMPMQELLDKMLTALPSNHRYSFLFRVLKKTGINIDVNLSTLEDVILDEGGKNKVVSPGKFNPNYADPQSSTIDVTITPSRTGKSFFRHVAHEMIHAATVFRYASTPWFRRRINKLWLTAVERTLGTSKDFDMDKVRELTKTNPDGAYNYIFDFLTSEPGDVEVTGQRASLNVLYGLTSPREFIAEAFTNIAFQETLASMKLDPTGNTIFAHKDYRPRFKNFLKVFFNEIKKTLGISTRNSVLEEVIILSTNMFDTNHSYDTVTDKPELARALLSGVVAGGTGPPGRGGLSIAVWKHKDTLMGPPDLAVQKAIDEILSSPDKLTKKDIVFLKKMLDRDPRLAGMIAAAMPTESLKVVETESKKKLPKKAINDVADTARGRDRWVRDAIQNLGQMLKDLPEQTNLGFMSRDQIERKYRRLFDTASKAAGLLTNPLTRYIRAKQAASVLAREYAERAAKSLQALQKMDNKTRSRVFKVMRIMTLSETWANVSLQHPLNAHLWGKPNKKGVSSIKKKKKERAIEARKAYAALAEENPAAAKIVLKMAGLTREIQAAKRAKSLSLIADLHELPKSTASALAKAKTPEDLQKIFKSVYDKDGNVVEQGTYPANLLVNKDKDSKEEAAKKIEKQAEFNELRKVAKSAETIIEHTSQQGPYFPLRRYGPIVVASDESWNDDNEPYVSFHSNRWEAMRVQAALKREYGMKTTRARKIESTALAPDMQAVVSELKARMPAKTEDGKSTGLHEKVETAMLEVLAENTAYASALRRHGVDGVASDDMGRAFEEYVFVAKYTLGDLDTTFEVTEAFKDMRRLQRAGDKISDEARDRIGMVVNELGEANKEDARDREISKLQRAVGTIGFFNFLGAPSYWVLNATQTLTVTLPYISGKWGVKKGHGAYKDAAATIAKAAKNAKSYEEFKQNLPRAAQLVVKKLEDQGIIQSTIAHEFGDMLSPSTLTRMTELTGPFGKAATVGLRMMEKIPETVEKYNRISTALAIYQLSDGNMQEVADGVQATQFNYDSANRARLLKAAPKWAGGGLRAVITPIMMFKTYGIGLARLLYGNMAKSLTGRTAAERAQARRIAGGLIVSHSIFGGVAGGIMMAPIQVIVEAFNAAFREAGDEFDPEEAVELFLQENANDFTAALVARGVPAALGLEMSKSINLGNLLFMGNDRLNFSDVGGVERWVAAGLGPVAQYAIGTVREGARFFSGDPRGNLYDFAAAAMPLKMLSGTIRGAKHEFEGVGTDTLTWMKPEDVTGWVRSAMGFRPTGIAMAQDLEYNILAREERRSRRKTQLINRLVEARTARERAAIWDDVQEFNKSLPSRADWINRGDVARLRSLRRTRQREYERERRRR